MNKQKSDIEKTEINILDLSAFLLKRKRFILGLTLALAVITADICFVMTPLYEAVTKIMPPQESVGSASELVGQFSGAARAIFLGGGSTISPSDLYAALFQTEAVLDEVIDQFELKKIYGVDTMTEARQILGSAMLKADADANTGIISVAVLDKDPQRAANMANAFVEELRELLGRISWTDDNKRRIFYEKELKKAHSALSRSEEELKAFQETSGVRRMDEQASAILQGIVNLKAEIAAKQVQITVMKSYATQNNPDLKKAEEELKAMNHELKKLEELQGAQTADVLIPSGQIPSLGTEYIRKMRDLKHREALWQLLANQYQAWRLEEGRDPAVVRVIYEAKAPERKAKPNLGLLVVLATAAGLFLFTVIALSSEIANRASEAPSNEERLMRIRALFKRL